MGIVIENGVGPKLRHWIKYEYKIEATQQKYDGVQYINSKSELIKLAPGDLIEVKYFVVLPAMSIINGDNILNSYYVFPNLILSLMFLIVFLACKLRVSTGLCG
jgi:hypothetical protein